MKIYTANFVQWLLNHYNIAEDQIYKHRGQTYKYYCIEEMLEKFKTEYNESGEVK